ncbi:MAG: GTPase Era [Hydrocarboniphaga sp.]|jgi:GTP-binding protein Era|uniref:GTPase Era n=2 Tax=Nevskiaceae TaxID=568386 RepID=I8I347_9GAMM|nr:MULTISPECIES: GTPase Era [Hydrocarboniphaga]EIT70421.1 GTP-binding protein Era [Hydrocarboniphaga effusa AP103]MDZ4078321.1 GTPase Era [Hydrocarboniphaga sp.]
MQSGIVTIIGRPNVGKSSLLNALIGRKVSIVSHKPQTTRHRIQGVLHEERGQIVFVDTPGLHRGEKKALNKLMNQAAAGAIHDVDLVLFVVEAGSFRDEDQAVLDRLKDVTVPVGLLVNKVDRVENKEDLFPQLEKLGALRDFAFVVPISATRGSNLKPLVKELFDRLPEGPPLYPEDMIVGYDNAFEASEIVREKLVRTLHQELPYALTVSIDRYQIEGKLRRIAATIWVERDGQKKIVIGEEGTTLKRVGTAARKELEYLTGDKVFLQLWCKVKENWSDDPKALRQFGYESE